MLQCEMPRWKKFIFYTFITLSNNKNPGLFLKHDYGWPVLAHKIQRQDHSAKETILLRGDPERITVLAHFIRARQLTWISLFSPTLMPLCHYSAYTQSHWSCVRWQRELGVVFLQWIIDNFEANLRPQIR